MWLQKCIMSITQLRYISKEFITQFLPENPVIVEAGAHRGRDTLAMHTCWPHATIHAFEPVPALFQKLKQATIDKKNIHCYNYALSNVTGTASLYQSDEQCDAISSLLKPGEITHEKPQVQFSPYQVPTITLDDWAKKYQIDHIDFLWFDLQGYELAALQSASNVLKNISVIHTEVSLTYRYEHNVLYPELKEFLQTHGFQVYAEALYHKTWGNVLFVRDNFL